MSASERASLLRTSPLKPGEVVDKSINLSSLSRGSSRGCTANAGIRFNFLFFKRLCLVLRVAIPGLCSKSLLLLVLLLLVRSTEEYNYYQVGILPSHFYSALTGKNLISFKDIMWKMVIIVVSLCICKSGGEFAAGLLYVKWRETITKYIHANYFYRRVYYVLNIRDYKVDNPDQRITQDVDRFCEEVSQALPKLILQPFLVIYYSYRTFISLGWYGVVGIYAFFVVSTIINKFIMGPIVSYVFLKERREGDFRFHHVQVRANAESIAFYDGGGIFEGKKADNRLKFLLQAQLGSVHWQLPLNYSVFMFDYVSTIISYSLVGVAIFSGKYDDLTPSQLASVVSQNSFFAMYLLNSFSTVVDTAVKFAEIAGYTHRLGELLQVLRHMERRHREEGSCCSERKLVISATTSTGGGNADDRSAECPRESVGVEIPSIITATTEILTPPPPQCAELAAVWDNVTIAPPHEVAPLIEGLSMELRKGRNVIILGETGTGKTSIFRVVRGLWPPLRGHAELCIPHNHHYVMFLPQRAHLTCGTLADQVTFPEAPKMEDYQGVNIASAVENKINECLYLAGLISLRDRLGGLNVPVRENWYDITTPGEGQRLSFARLFYHMPAFAFLDEATSSLSESCEEFFYSKMVDCGITFMSIGHRTSLKKFHHQVLVVGRGQWQLDMTNDS